MSEIYINAVRTDRKETLSGEKFNSMVKGINDLIATLIEFTREYEGEGIDDGDLEFLIRSCNLAIPTLTNCLKSLPPSDEYVTIDTYLGHNDGLFHHIRNSAAPIISTIEIIKEEGEEGEEGAQQTNKLLEQIKSLILTLKSK